MGGGDDVDTRQTFLFRQISHAFRSIGSDRLNEWWSLEETTRRINDFLDSSDTNVLFLRESRGSSIIEFIDLTNWSNDKTFIGNGMNYNMIFYFLKLISGSLNENSIKNQLVYGDINPSNVMDHMISIAQRVYFPFLNASRQYAAVTSAASALANTLNTKDALNLISPTVPNLNIGNMVGASSSSGQSTAVWSDTVVKEVSSAFDSFVASVQITQGYVRGLTCLPPPHGATSDDLREPVWKGPESPTSGRSGMLSARRGSFGERGMLTARRGNAKSARGSFDRSTSAKVAAAAIAAAASVGSDSSVTSLDGTNNEDPESFGLRNIHVLEGILIVWTKQIKNILQMDPESLFINHAAPSPLDELVFWRSKARHLNSIFNQLQSQRVRKVLKVLDKSKSTYNLPFAKLCKEVFHARAEANNIVKYLHPLEVWLESLENESEYEALPYQFTPIIHMILLIWKSSPYYNTPARLVVLMRELCNTLVKHSSAYLNSDTIFELIDAGETTSLVKNLKTILNVCGRFKSTYFEYKMRVSVECPNNQWIIQNNAIFIRLDTFLERCHDILDFTQTILMFTKLSKIEVGGTKGKTLTASIAQVYSDFNNAVDEIRIHAKSILDLDNKMFEEAFYDFRTRIKELDRRLGSIIVQGFEDASTVTGRFRLLDSFDVLVNRPIVADALEKKHAALIDAMRSDLLEVQETFTRLCDTPVIPNNLPPIVGALMWCRNLRDRIDLLMTKLRTLDKKILERDDCRDTIKVYTALIGVFGDFERGHIEAWGETIEASSQAKLKNPLLARITPTNVQTTVNTTGRFQASALLRVNFDPVLVKLLREVKYFLQLGLEVPQSAMEIYSMVEVFRRHVGNLELIVNMYNDIQTSLLPVERPLLRGQLDRVDKTLAQGIGEVLSGGKGGVVKSKALNWKSNGIEQFIGEAMTEVRDVNEILQMLKRNLKSVESTVALWQTQPIFERGYKTALTIDFVNLQKKTRQNKLATVKDAGQEIHRLLKDTNKKLKVSQGLPDWKAYVDFINNVVVYGLTEAMASSLRAMAAQFNASHLEANGLPALLEIQCDLVNSEVVFIPEVGLSEGGHRGTTAGIRNIVLSWINGMLGLANAFKRVDGGEGTYLRELGESPNVLMHKLRVMKYLATMENNANRLRAAFNKFSYLWQRNANEDFAQFLSDVVVKEKVPIAHVSADGQSGNVATSNVNANNAVPGETSTMNPSACNPTVTLDMNDPRNYWERTTINLTRFSERIKQYLEIQTEVSDIKQIHDVDFLRINAQPVKQAISTWVTKWLYLHTHYLQNYVWERLSDVHEFMSTVNRGLDQPIDGSAAGKETLMAMLGHIHSVRKRMPEISSLFDPLDEIVALLKSHGVAFDVAPIGGQPALDFLEHIRLLWDNTVNKAFRVKENIQPAQSSLLESVRKEVKGFQTSVSKVVKDFHTNGPFIWSETTNTRDAYASLDRVHRSVVDLQKNAKKVNDLEELFELTVSTHGSISGLINELVTLKGVWDMVTLVESLFTSWKATLWAEIHTDTLSDEAKKIQTQLKRFPKRARDWSVFKRLDLEVRNMVTVLPLVHDLHAPAMRDRHWKQLGTLTGTVIDRGTNFCLSDLLSLDLQNHVEAVSDIVEVAGKELKIETKLSAIEETWRRFSLQFVQHRDTEILVVAAPDEILETLEEHSLVLQSMAGMGKFVDHFRESVGSWQSALGEVETNLKLILLVQRQWGSLESIFLGSADIRAQLPDDTKRFEGVDSEFKEIMRDVQSRPGVLECCRTDGREATLLAMHRELEKCEKALNEYLEVKKLAFPRFYFVSNAALLDILSNGNSPPKIIPHIGSVFDGIGGLELCPSSSQLKASKDDPDAVVSGPLEAAKAMISKDNEIVPFTSLFEMKGAVEYWLNELVKFMQMTLRGCLYNSMADAMSWEDVNRSREDWVFTVPAQIALVTSQIVWSEEVEAAMEELEAGQEDALKKYNELCTARLEGLIRLVQGDLTRGDRVKIITVITIDVHNRDVVSSLVAKKVESSVDFKWQSQLRYYWQPEDRSVAIRICDFLTQYSFEYTGNCGRLVITPLTDRCYVTLTVALRLMMGGAPAGPAGTGKTETTKDLSRGLGVPCYVFNCSDQMNYQTMGDIFKGLTQVGAWGCFDEFNRIEIEVLSVVASQVRAILDAILLFSVPANRQPAYQNLPAGTPPLKVGTFNFFGDEISLVPTVGLFITMNPGYAGRTELPENLKALFRSCAMIQPDFLPICENMLMAEGFVRARPLSVKFVTLYRLSSELLSKQHHYDWGLRAIKSVLRVAGMLKRSEPDVEEEAVLMRALRDFNTPKIPAMDIPIFLRLIADLFPSLDLPTKWNEPLYKACVEVCRQQGLCAEEGFIAKVLQYEEILEVRHSVMLLGPAGCGKSTVWKTLAACHNFMGALKSPKASHGMGGGFHREGSSSGSSGTKAVTVFETINPKSVTTDELYGYMTLARDWKDGVLSIVMRNMSKNVLPYAAHQSAKWVVLDGDIDAVWIESMNTVMDDNKVLTLVSNERIPLSDSMRMVFEIHSLKNATPATVSRAGILYINSTDIGYAPFLESWMAARQTELERSVLPYLTTRYLAKCVEWLTQNKAESIVSLPLINLVQSFCFLLEGMLDTLTEKTQASMERTYLYCLMWAFGGSLVSEKTSDWRKLFSNFFRSLSKNVKFPESDTVFDYAVDLNTGDVVSWQSKLAASLAADGAFGGSGGNNGNGSNGGNIVASTADSLRLTFLVDTLVRHGRHVMFVGSAGTGKTLFINHFLSSLTSSDPSYRSTTINMNYYTDSLALQMQLEQHIDKRSGKNYGPPSGHLVYFVDDLNLPFVETYGTQTPIELMRQHVDHGSWYDRNDLSLKKTISDCQYIAAMNHKSGSFSINPRLQRHFSTFAYQMASDSDLFTIFHAILSDHFFSFEKRVLVRLRSVMEGTIALHHEVSNKFLPSAVKFHYNFTMRDISAVIRGMLYARPTNLTTAGHLARLWYHEVTRVYSDRLISEQEIARCREVVVNVGKRFLADDDADTCFAEPCFFAHYAPAPVVMGLAPSSPLAANNAGNAGQHDDTVLGSYRNCDDVVRLKAVLENKLAEYNESAAMMDLVLFEQAIRHILRITRILLFPGGHALLIGVGGSGKQSLSRLASFICGYPVHQLAVRSDFTVNDLKEVLRDLYRRAAIKPGEPLVFLLTDAQIVDERFLVYVNDLLASGVIPDLFTKEDYDGIFSLLRPIAKAEGIPDNRDSMFEFFTQRVRANLHMILCFSPVGETFRTRARRFPGIVSCTMIDWFLEWPREALVSVAQRFLEDLPLGPDAPPECKDNIAYHIAEVHVSVGEASIEYAKREKRYNYTTPRSFLELISFYKTLLTVKQTEMIASINRLDTGLQTLSRTNEDVEKLQIFLVEKKKEVEAKRAATDKLLEEMGQQRSEAEAQQKIADVENEKANLAAKNAEDLRQQAEGDLQAAEPALKAAENAVNCLDKNSLTVLKSFTKPPAGVDKVTTALLIMIQGEKKDFSWENAKKMMAKVDGFKAKLESYRGEDIPEDVIAKVSPIMADPDFTYEKMKLKSEAAANLANWVINIIQFNAIYKRVRPLMDSLEVATKLKDKAMEELAVVKATLAAIEEKLATLQVEFMAATQEKARVEAEAKECLDRLSLAERLTKGLSSEQERWSSTVDKLRQKALTLPGDVMLAASFTSYLGAFNAYFREHLWKEKWLADLKAREIPLSDGLDPLLHILSSESQIANWQNESLPSDRISLENGSILVNSSRWPLLIDPQLQGIRWLTQHARAKCEKSDSKLHVILTSDRGWMTRITTAITNGDTVIIENIDEHIDASLDPILSRAVYKKGKTLYIKVGDEAVEYDPRFQLYLQTKIANPHYKPETFAQCTIINFIVTRSGLEDQLLGQIVSEEEPELERTRTELVLAFNNYKIQLQELEDTLLTRLANAPEDILSDVPLIESLEATKQTATEINDAVLRGIQTEIGINNAREVYRVIATEASLLYFVLLQLNSIDHMYQYSLDSFVMFFLKALKSAPTATNPLERVNNLQLGLRLTIFKFVNRGLFAKNKLIFLTQMSLALIQQRLVGEDCGFSPDALRFLLVNPRYVEEKSPVNWISDNTWNGLKTLSTTVEGFERLAGDIEENSARFYDWYQSFAPESERLPGSWRELDRQPFKKLLILRVLRPDRIISALLNFIRDLLPQSKEFVECDSEFSSFQVLEQSFEDSTPAIPLYFILSPGANIVSDIDRLAMKYGKAKNVEYHNISLGQGQDRIAEEKLDIAFRQGHWILLNNIHLMPRWLHKMEKRLESYAMAWQAHQMLTRETTSGGTSNAPNTDGTTTVTAAVEESGSSIHPQFRVFFSSDPSEKIPIGMLDRCIKLTSDPPSGLKANIKQAIACFPKETFEELESRTRGILMGLIQFHAVMVERKKFGTKGFNMNYPFSLGDLTCSFQVLRNYMDTAPAKVPWADLRYLFGEIMYGGHIVNDLDRQLANTYLDFYMREEILEEMSLLPFADPALLSSAMGGAGATGGAAPSLADSFRAPPTSASYDVLLEHIDEHFRVETPLVFGLHPNAEISFRTQGSEDLLRSILDLGQGAIASTSSKSSGENDNDTSGEVRDQQQVVEAQIQELMEQFRDIRFEVDNAFASPEDIGPFQNVVLQECERMTTLIRVMTDSLIELDLGFKGDLTVSDAMEELSNSIYLDRVPKKWEAAAFPSLRSLSNWIVDINNRINQLQDWVSGGFELPAVTWLGGLFNPQSFLTCILQLSAQSQGLELDKLSLSTDVTKKLAAEEVTVAAREGTYISGLWLEGACWNSGQGVLEPARPRELFAILPVLHLRAQPADRIESGMFACPVFRTQQRGPTYVFSLTFRTKIDPARWTLAGVVALMDVTM